MLTFEAHLGTVHEGNVDDGRFWRVGSRNVQFQLGVGLLESFAAQLVPHLFARRAPGVDGVELDVDSRHVFYEFGGHLLRELVRFRHGRGLTNQHNTQRFCLLEGARLFRCSLVRLSVSTM